MLTVQEQKTEVKNFVWAKSYIGLKRLSEIKILARPISFSVSDFSFVTVTKEKSETLKEMDLAKILISLSLFKPT